MRDSLARIRPALFLWLSTALMVCVVAFADPVFPGLAIACLVLVRVAAGLNHAEWSRRIQGGGAGRGRVRHVDRPGASGSTPAWSWVVCVTLVIVVALVLEQAGHCGFGFARWLLIVVGASLWLSLRGFPVMYTITEQGIWIQSGIGREFLSFTRLDSVIHYPGRAPSTRHYAAYATRSSDFVALVHKDPIPTYSMRRGPGRCWIKLLTPSDSIEFMGYLPGELIAEEE